MTSGAREVLASIAGKHPIIGDLALYQALPHSLPHVIASGELKRLAETDRRIRGGNDMKSTFGKTTALFGVLLAGAILTAPAVAQFGPGHADSFRDQEELQAQITELEQLHATFHAAISVQNPAGDSDEVITQRIRLILSIFAQDAKLTTAAGNYVGNGDPEDPATCPPPSGDTSPTGQQGTLCTFFKYVAGGLQPGNHWVSLTPAYKTKYVPVKKDGQWTSSVYFECHYFDVSTADGQAPPWTAESHVNLQGEARKIDGKWLLTTITSSPVGVPLPPPIEVPAR